MSMPTIYVYVILCICAHCEQLQMQCFKSNTSYSFTFRKSLTQNLLAFQSRLSAHGLHTLTHSFTSFILFLTYRTHMHTTPIFHSYYYRLICSSHLNGECSREISFNFRTTWAQFCFYCVHNVHVFFVFFFPFNV